MGESKPAADGNHRAHLERSRRVWDFWSRHYDFNERDTEQIRAAAVDHLGLQAGDVVLDVGCGPGVNFELLHEAVGPAGRIVAVDYSPEMVDRARARADERGWANVEVVRADATRIALEPTSFDAALATLALSAMPDVPAVVRTVHDALRPGSRFAVHDARLVPSGPARVLNPLIALFYRYVVNRNEDADVLGTLREQFPDVEVVATYAAGTNYVAVAETAGDAEARR